MPGQSRAAYRSKLSIVIEEADESEFWLEFIEDINLQVREKNKLPYLKNEAHELASIFIVTRRSLEEKRK